MAFLTVNGITIPTAKGGVQEIVEIGDRQRAFDGTYIRDTRAFKRRWKFTTKPISELRAMALRGLIQGRGYYFGYDNTDYAANGFAASSVGTGITYRAINGADTTAAYDENGVREALYGTYSVAAAVTAGSTLTNMITSAIAQCTNLTGTTASSGATASLDTSQFWQGTTSFKIVGNGVTALPQIRLVAAMTTNTVSGHKYTASCYLKGSGQAYLNFFDNSGGQNAQSATLTLNASWQRVSATITATGTPPSLYIDVIGVLGTATVYMDGIMLEDNNTTTNGGSFATSFIIPGTARAEGKIQYVANPMGPEGMTINFWTSKPRTYSDVQYAWYVTDNSSGARNMYVRVPAATPTSLEFSSVGSAGSDVITASGLSYTNWHMVTAVLRINPETGETLKSLYFDGVSKVTSNVTSTTPNYGDLSRFAIADTYYSTSVTPWFARLDDVQVLPFPVDANWITGTFGLGGTPGATPFLTARGDLFPEPDVRVMGQVESLSYMGYSDAGTWRPNGCVLSFTLEEV